MQSPVLSSRHRLSHPSKVLEFCRGWASSRGIRETVSEEGGPLGRGLCGRRWRREGLPDEVSLSARVLKCQRQGNGVYRE